MNWYAFTPKRRRLSDSIIVYAHSAEEAEKYAANLDPAGSPYQMYLVDNAPTYSSSFIYLKKVTVKRQK